MSKLTITSNQEAVVTAIGAALEDALYSGTNNILDPMPSYAAITDPVIKKQIKDFLESLAAATIKSLNIPRALPNSISTTSGSLTFVDGILTNNSSTGLSVTVPLAKLTPTGNPGSLTFVDGILVSRVDPT